MKDGMWKMIKGFFTFLLLLGVVYFYLKLQDAYDTGKEFNIPYEAAKSIKQVFNHAADGFNYTDSVKVSK